MPCSAASSHIVAASTLPPRWACSSASGSSGAKIATVDLRSRRTSGLDELLELSGLVHLGHDVAAADELPVDEELRDRGPVGPVREDVAQPRVDEHVARLVLGADDAADLGDLVREAAA